MENSFVPTVQVVSCFIQKGHQILVLQRARKDQQHNLWGIPGGKLKKAESPVDGLIRELHEETGLCLSAEAFTLLGTTLSKTPCDGQYGLYIYFAVVPENTGIKIDFSEHYAYRWVSIEEFLQLPLLTAQGEAFQLVQDKLGIFFENQEAKKTT